jgi:hypothetical protein
MLALPQDHAEFGARWRRAAELILNQADVAAVSRQVHLALFYDAPLDIGAMGALSLAAESVQSPTPSNRMGAFDEVRNRSASACPARRVGRFGSDPRTIVRRGAARISHTNAKCVDDGFELQRLPIGIYATSFPCSSVTLIAKPR